MGTDDWAIDLRTVSKTYNKKIRALREVDMRVGRGEIFGLLGPNGAGKSTLVKIMMTVVFADHAEGSILGQPLGHQPTLGRIGYLPEGHRFPAFLTAAQALEFYGKLSLVPPDLRRQRAADWLERLGMTRWAQTPVGRYSKGMLQRLGIVQTLIHDPDLIVLDEPTDGVDPIGRRDIRQILCEMKERGKTIFINSHILSELEMVCDRVAILVQGQVARQGSIEELTAHSMIYEVSTTEPLDDLKPQIAELGGTVDGPRVVIEGNDASEVNKVIDVLRAHQRLVEAVRPKRWSLEDVFMDAASSLGRRG